MGKWQPQKFELSDGWQEALIAIKKRGHKVAQGCTN
jgi:hypothetical protein